MFAEFLSVVLVLTVVKAPVPNANVGAVPLKPPPMLNVSVSLFLVTDVR